jgi:MFS family permease
MEKQHRNVLVLCSTQATLQITTVTMVAVTGLAGYALVDNKSFATVPLTAYVLGSAITTIPASLLMGAIGRRAGFQLGSAAGIVGGVICATAIWLANFWLLCAGMMVMGIYTAFGKYYRLAAADAASSSFKAKAISFTLAGGILGGVLGPELAKYTYDLTAGYLAQPGCPAGDADTDAARHSKALQGRKKRPVAAARRDHAATGVHRRGTGGHDVVRHHEPDDDLHAAGDARA